MDEWIHMEQNLNLILRPVFTKQTDVLPQDPSRTRKSQESHLYFFNSFEI